jgi:hypothetical protein
MLKYSDSLDAMFQALADPSRRAMVERAGLQGFRDPAAKRRWFIEGEGWDVESYESDFRVGGLETSRFRFKELKRSAAAA